ncbi:MAG: hypothetical protein DMF19_10500 [Verrucomicrobia bacterium]|nr:MAG: hypothetical protein DMF19_10500 [Verrucomicrobiota bacterium]
MEHRFSACAPSGLAARCRSDRGRYFFFILNRRNACWAHRSETYMKRVFQHPPAPTSGRRYWRSTDELADTPEFREWLEREFPSSAAQLNGDEWSRRSFLKLMGASVALAGFGVSSCRRPELHLVPFTKTVEWTIPGKFLYYSTAMPRRNGAIPLLVTTVDGRPIKLDGNPLHPASNGASDVFVQATINELYNPLRAKRIAENGKTSTAAAFEKYLGDLRKKMGDGAGLAFLVEETHSPTRERIRGELEKIFPRMHWCVYDPLRSEAQNFATQISFGDNLRLVPFSASRQFGEGLDEPALCRREPLYPHRSDGRSPASFAGEPNSADCTRNCNQGGDSDKRCRPGFRPRHLAGSRGSGAVRRAMVERSGKRSGFEIGRQPGFGRPATAGRRSVACLRN